QADFFSVSKSRSSSEVTSTYSFSQEKSTLSGVDPKSAPMRPARTSAAPTPSSVKSSSASLMTSLKDCAEISGLAKDSEDALVDFTPMVTVFVSDLDADIPEDSSP